LYENLVSGVLEDEMPSYDSSASSWCSAPALSTSASTSLVCLELWHVWLSEWFLVIWVWVLWVLCILIAFSVLFVCFPRKLRGSGGRNVKSSLLCGFYSDYMHCFGF
jgi:hypothetical protein